MEWEPQPHMTTTKNQLLGTRRLLEPILDEAIRPLYLPG
jgi:hypothetical protein